MLFFAACTCTHVRTRALESGHRVSIAPVFARREIRVSQVPGSSSSLVPCSMTLQGCGRTLARFRVRHRDLKAYQHPRQPECFAFRGCIQTRPKRSRAYASPLGCLNGTRLATDWWGCTLVGRVSHLLDDELNFIGSSHHPLLPDQPCLVTLVFTIPDRMAAMFVILHPCSLSSFAQRRGIY